MTRKFLSISFYVAVSIIILCALAATFVSYVLKDLKYYTELTLEHVKVNTGYDITIDDINWSLTRGAGLRIDNLSITDTRNNVLLFTSKHVHVLTALSPLVRKHIKVSRILLIEPEIFIIRNSDGVWNSFFSSAPTLGSTSSAGDFFDFSILLKRLFIKKGKLFFKDERAGVAYDFSNIDLKMLLNRLTKKYVLEASAERTEKPADGRVQVKGEFFFTADENYLQNLSGRGRLAIEAIPLGEFSAYTHDLLRPLLNNALLNAELDFSLNPNMLFSADGSIACKGISLYTKRNGLSDCTVVFDLKGHRESILCDGIEFSIDENIKFVGTCNLTDIKEGPPLLTLDLKSNMFNIIGLSGLTSLVAVLPAPAAEMMQKITKGRMKFKNLMLQTGLEKSGREILSALQAGLELTDAEIPISEHMPPVTITNGNFELNNSKITGYCNVRWLPGDTHTLHTEIYPLFNTSPCVTASLETTCPALSLNTLLPILVKEPDSGVIVQATSGFVSAKTDISYCSDLTFLSEIALTRAAYQVKSALEKPKGVANTLFISGKIAEDPRKNPFSFIYSLDNGLLIEGTVQGRPTAEVTGSYSAELFDIARLDFPALPPPLQLSGLLEGAGLFQFPPVDPCQKPLTGMLTIKDFELGRQDAPDPLITANIVADCDGKTITVHNSTGSLGSTSFNFSGMLNNALPPEGTLVLDAPFYDIDDFVDVILQIKKTVEHDKAEDESTPSPAEEIFKQTFLDADLKVKKVNFLNWDGQDASSSYSYKKAVMHWDNVIIKADTGGTVYGSVLLDFSQPHLKKLELVSRKSDVDFCWCVPGLKQKQTIIGTTNLVGRFTSTYRNKAEIGRNMGGEFHVTVTNGEIKKLVLLSKILTLLDITRLLQLKGPDMLAKTMPFDVIESDFIMKKGVMTTDNLVLKSPAMNLSAVGSIDLRNNTVDLTIGVQILPTIGKILGNIPIAGEIFTGDDKALTFGYFHVTGPYQEPTVRPLPIKSISTPIINIFKKILNIPKDILLPKSKEKP